MKYHNERELDELRRMIHEDSEGYWLQVTIREGPLSTIDMNRFEEEVIPYRVSIFEIRQLINLLDYGLLSIQGDVIDVLSDSAKASDWEGVRNILADVARLALIRDILESAIMYVEREGG